MWKKIRNLLYDSSDILELVMAILVLFAVLIATVSLYKPFLDFVDHRFEYGALLGFMGYVFNILIGIEFLKMLCHPSPNAVLEVLSFLVARHMILEPTTVIENFISIISIGVMFAVKKYLHLPANDGESGDIFVSDYTKEKRAKRHQRWKERKEKITSKMEEEESE